jgi:hypothetical protein
MFIGINLDDVLTNQDEQALAASKRGAFRKL